MAKAIQVNYQVIENQLSSQLQKELTERLNRHWVSGRDLRGLVLKYVVNGEYQSAIQELNEYIESRSEYVNFQLSISAAVKHAIDLIMAIQDKRNLPGLGALNLAKRQELSESVERHFGELKIFLTQIQKNERTSRIADVRTTVWVVKAFTCSVFAIFAVFLLREINMGTFHSLGVLFEHYADKIASLLV